MVRAVLLFSALVVSMGAHSTTPNFVVETSDPQLCEQIGQTAEKLRRELALSWLGKTMPDWSAPCVMTVHVGPSLGAGGATTFLFDRGEVYGWRMTIQGSAERVLDSVLPHEITHMVFASHFRCPLPRWADEGGATSVEHISEKQKHNHMLVQFLHTNRGIAFNQMFAMKEYPQDVMPLYAQGYSLAEYLIEQGGRPRFLAFLGEGLKDENWNAAADRYYGYRDLGVLQNSWLNWVRNGFPPLQQRTAPDQLVAEVVQPRPRPEPNLILRVAGNEPITGQSWQPRPMVPYAPNPQPTPAAPAPTAVRAEVTHPQSMGNW
jgi:hypothetical protein